MGIDWRNNPRFQLPAWWLPLLFAVAPALRLVIGPPLPKPWGPWVDVAFLVLLLTMSAVKVWQMRKSTAVRTADPD